jgi:hypothetical protein
MARPSTDDQNIEDACMSAHGAASSSLELLDLNTEIIFEIHDRVPQMRDWLVRLLENQKLLNDRQRDIQRQMRRLLDGEQKRRTDTDRLGKLRKASND